MTRGSHVALDVVGHAGSLRLHGDSRSCVGPLDVGVVVVAVVQLEQQAWELR